MNRQFETVPILRSARAKQSAAEEADCIRRWQSSRDSAAASAVVAAQLHRVLIVARKFCNYGVPLEDLVSEGTVGVMKALDRFQLEKGVRFSTYSEFWVKAEIVHCVLRSWTMMSGPQRALSSRVFFRLRRERARLRSECELNSSDHASAELTEALAGSFGVKPETMEEMLWQLDQRDLSLDAPAKGEETETLGERLQSRDDQEAAYFAKQREQLLRTAIRDTVLDAREREILHERLVAEPDRCASLAELGTRLGVSRERVRQLEERTCLKLASSLRARLPAEDLAHEAQSQAGRSAKTSAGAEPRRRRSPLLGASCAALGVLLLLPSQAALAAEPGTQVQVVAEQGFLSVLSHRVQFSQTGTNFDYVESGGQDVLFAFSRLQLELSHGRHRVIALYQPLELVTEVALTEPLTVDGLTLPTETPVSLRYGFPFYRLGYQYSVYVDATRTLALGGALQIRNATISFRALDGTGLRSNRDVGPVPLLSARWRHSLSEHVFWGIDVDGFYAPVKYLNGGDSDVVGAIVDANLNAGLVLSEHVSVFANLRWLGGGAEGTGDPGDFGDGYTENWLNFATVSLGIRAALN